MKKLIYYITDHGRGHATRSVATIRELMKFDIEVIIRNSNLKEFLHKSLPKINVISGKTDVGPVINNDGISINENKTRESVTEWINELDYQSEIELTNIQKLQPNLIISDISTMPLIVAKKMKVNSIAVSNFSWYDVLKFLPQESLQKIREAYDNATLAIQLPIGTEMDHFRNKKRVGLVCRIPTKTRKELRKNFGIGESDIAISFALGGSNVEVDYKNGENIRIISMGTLFKNRNKVINLSDYVEGQDVVAASDLVICKCGHGMISECITNNIPFLYLTSDNHLEQIAMSKELFSRGWGKKITLSEIQEFHLNKEYLSIKPGKEPVDTKNLVKYILEFLKN